MLILVDRCSGFPALSTVVSTTSFFLTDSRLKGVQLMKTEKLATALPRFIQQVTQAQTAADRPLTINDLRVSIRSERLSEISDWSTPVLDLVEVQAAQFEEATPLQAALSVAIEDVPEASRVAVASICGPSPVAWM
jgi:hypothetical protein